jgi:hypothetical protein
MPTNDLGPEKVAPIRLEDLNDFGSTYPVPAPLTDLPDVDLVAELQRRGIAVSEEGVVELHDQEIWTPSVKDQLRAVLDDLERRGVRYRFTFDHQSASTEVTLARVTLELRGP